MKWQTPVVQIPYGLRVWWLLHSKSANQAKSDPESISKLRAAGFKGFLIGETFMKTDDPGKACKEFIEKLK